METRTINGQRATDRVGAGELLGISTQTVAFYASPKQRPSSGFPEPVGHEDGRDWYALDHLYAYAQRRREAGPAKPPRAPAWLRDGDPDDLLPATTFREAAGVRQGTWKRYVQESIAQWEAGRDGYLPKPDRSEDYRGTGKRYFWKRHRMVNYLDHRPGQRSGAGRKAAASSPTIQDAVTALRDAGGNMSYTALAAALGVNHSLAQYLLKQARHRINEPTKP